MSNKIQETLCSSCTQFLKWNESSGIQYAPLGLLSMGTVDATPLKPKRHFPVLTPISKHKHFDFFLELPPEIRINIYLQYINQRLYCGSSHNCLESTGPEVRFEGAQHIRKYRIPNLSLLFVSKLIHAEFVGIAYSHISLLLTICGDFGVPNTVVKPGIPNLWFINQYLNFHKFTTVLTVRFSGHLPIGVLYFLAALEKEPSASFMLHDLSFNIEGLIGWIENFRQLRKLEIVVEAPRDFVLDLDKDTINELQEGYSERFSQAIEGVGKINVILEKGELELPV